MAQKERLIMDTVRKNLSRGPVRLFRNNCGMGWQGQIARVTPETLSECRQDLRPGDMIIRGPRPLHAGLDTGSGDLIGWRQVDITPSMVGSTIAQFVSAEAKSLHGRMKEHQDTWRDLVNSHGGLAFKFVSEGQARNVLRCDTINPAPRTYRL